MEINDSFFEITFTMAGFGFHGKFPLVEFGSTTGRREVNQDRFKIINTNLIGGMQIQVIADGHGGICNWGTDAAEYVATHLPTAISVLVITNHKQFPWSSYLTEAKTTADALLAEIEANIRSIEASSPTLYDFLSFTRPRSSELQARNPPVHLQATFEPNFSRLDLPILQTFRQKLKQFLADYAEWNPTRSDVPDQRSDPTDTSTSTSSDADAKKKTRTKLESMGFNAEQCDNIEFGQDIVMSTLGLDDASHEIKESISFADKALNKFLELSAILSRDLPKLKSFYDQVGCDQSSNAAHVGVMPSQVEFILKRRDYATRSKTAPIEGKGRKKKNLVLLDKFVALEFDDAELDLYNPPDLMQFEDPAAPPGRNTRLAKKRRAYINKVVARSTWNGPTFVAELNDLILSVWDLCKKVPDGCLCDILSDPVLKAKFETIITEQSFITLIDFVTKVVDYNINGYEKTPSQLIENISCLRETLPSVKKCLLDVLSLAIDAVKNKRANGVPVTPPPSPSPQPPSPCPRSLSPPLEDIVANAFDLVDRHYLNEVRSADAIVKTRYLSNRLADAHPIIQNTCLKSFNINAPFAISSIGGGCTAVVNVITSDGILTANAGDSLTYIASIIEDSKDDPDLYGEPDFNAVCPSVKLELLSSEHNARLLSQRECLNRGCKRILNGDYIAIEDPALQVNHYLQPTAGFGDIAFKEPIPCISVTPSTFYYYSCDVKDSQRHYLISVSDGYTQEEVKSIVLAVHSGKKAADILNKSNDGWPILFPKTNDNGTFIVTKLV